MQFRDKEHQPKGFNSNLPGALPSKDSSWNKLKFYEEADKDSAKYKTLQRNDPNYSLPAFNPTNHSLFDTVSNNSLASNRFSSAYDPYPTGLQSNRDPNEEKVYRKISQLNEELKKVKQSSAIKDRDAIDDFVQPPSIESNPNGLNSLHNLTQNDPGIGNSGDPEMQQINGMLEKNT